MPPVDQMQQNRCPRVFGVSAQHTLQSGNRVNAVIHLGHAIVPIDAKYSRKLPLGR
jgi:hypothetical protein